MPSAKPHIADPIYPPANDYTLSVRRLCVAAYGNGYTGWHYRCESHDELRAILANPFFFKSGPATMRPGDTIMASSESGAVHLVVVAAPARLGRIMAKVLACAT